MDQLKKLSDHNWKVTIELGTDSNGKRIRKAKQGFRTKDDAKKYAAEILAQHTRGLTPSKNGDLLLSSFITSWFNDYKCQIISITTKNDYHYRINSHIIPSLGSYKLKDLNTLIVQDFYNKLISEKKMKPTSAKKVFDILNGCLKYAIKLEYIYKLPTNIEKQRCKKPIIKYWDKKQIDFFLNEIKGTYLYTPIFLDVLTGLRIAELCGLCWKNINFKKCTLEVSNQVVQDKVKKELILSSVLKTSTSSRIISIPKVLVDHLEEIKNSRNAKNNDFVILNRNNCMCTPRNLSMEFTKKVSNYKKSLDDLEEEFPDRDFANYMQLTQITFHGIRHSHATLLIFNGDNIKVVSKRLGHSNIGITLNTYMHVMKDMENNTANLLDNLF